MTVRPLSPTLASLGRIRGVRAAVLASLDDAIPIESCAHVDVDVDALAAFATALYRRARLTADQAEAGALTLVSLEASGGRLSAGAHGELLLAVLAERETHTGLLRLALQRALEALD